jgi:general stress protein YciG
MILHYEEIIMTGTSEGGKKAAAKQDMSEKGRKGGEASHKSSNQTKQTDKGRSNS